MTTFESHKGPRERNAKAAAERRAREKWDSELGAAMQAELNATPGSHC